MPVSAIGVLDDAADSLDRRFPPAVRLVDCTPYRYTGAVSGPFAQRLAWIDAARALCVSGVVLMHFLLLVYAPTTERFPDDTAAWSTVSGTLLAFRMPLLFAVSGLLVADRVRAGWSDRRNLVRVASSYDLYAVWLLVYALISLFLPGSMPYRISSVQDFVSQLLIPETPLWFVLFLAVNVILLTSVSAVHPAIVMAGLFALSMWSLAFDFPAGLELIGRGFYYLLFFAVGVYLPSAVRFLASAGLWWKLAIAFITFLWVTNVLARLEYMTLDWLAGYVLQDLVGVALGVVIVAILCRIPFVARGLQFVGTRTLPIYVLHVPVIWVALALAEIAGQSTIDNAPMRAVVPVAATVLIMGACIGLAALINRYRLGRMLFDLPAPASSRILGRPIA